MQNRKLLLVILGLLLSFVTMAFDNSQSFDDGKANLVGKTYPARVISQKAIVYADENMLSPLGYIANGKLIIVGNPRRMNRSLVPTVIYGRLAFVEIKDIKYEDSVDEELSIKRGAPREHNFDVTLQKPEEVLSQNNSFYFNLHSYTAGSDVKRAFAVIQDAEKNSFTGFNFHLIHRQTTSRFFWGAGLDYSYATVPNMKFAYWLLTPTVGYSLMRNPLFLIDIYASFDLTLNSELEVSNNFESEPTGYMWGPQVNARIVFFPEARYHLTGGVGLRKYKVNGLLDLKDLNDNYFDGIDDISGVSISIGFGMEFR